MNADKTERAQEIRALLDAERRKPGSYQDMQRLLIRYAVERFLYRLGLSSYGSKFVLKGALLLAIYISDEFRSTGDGDLLALGHFTAERLLRIFEEVCAIEHDDGLIFNPSGIEMRETGAEREYPGYAVVIPTSLGASSCNVRLDIGFGQAVTPRPQLVDYPSLLDLAKPKLRIYPLETVIAEKFHAIVHLGVSNTRLKDYHDLAEIALRSSLSGNTLCQAIKATFKRRRTQIPTELPQGLTSIFFDSRDKQSEWKAFLKRHSLRKRLSLKETSSIIADLMLPVIQACAVDHVFKLNWHDQSWHDDSLSEKPLEN